MSVSKKRLAGVAASMVLFAMFGLVFGQLVVGFTGVGFDDPVRGLATGPTIVALAPIFEPFGLTAEVIGLAPDTAVILPGVGVTIQLLGVTLSVAEFSLAQVSMGGGALVGLVVGLYYVVVFAYEDATNDEGEPTG